VDLGLGTGFGGDAEGDIFINLEGVLGSEFDDVLIGNVSGDAILSGRAGNDILVGGNSDDLFAGGTGSDVFVFRDNFGNDRIIDFDASASGDQIDLSLLSAISDFQDLIDNHLEVDEDDVLHIVDGDNSITLDGVNILEIDESDFIF